MRQSTKLQRLLALMIVFGLLFSLASCGQPEPAEEATPVAPAEPSEPAEEATDVLKLGVLGPFSGPSARTGDEFKAAVNMAFDAIGWQIGKYKIEPVWIRYASAPTPLGDDTADALLQSIATISADTR